MKVIAHTGSDTMLVEMSENEFAICAGQDSMYSMRREKSLYGIFERRNGEGPVGIGATIDVRAAFGYITKLRDHEKKARDCAGILTHMAEMITIGLPSTVLPPEDPEGGPKDDHP